MANPPPDNRPADRSDNWRRDRVFWLILGVACALALAYNWAIIVGLGPDEGRHMNYVKLLLDQHRLPVIENADPSHYRETANAHAFHPPLYHLLLLPFYALFRGLPDASAWHLVRAVSSLFCLASLPLLYEIALAGSRDRTVTRLTVATVALVPIFGMTAGIINNDAAALFFTSLFLYLLTVRFAARRDLKSALILGVVLGLGGLCKATVLLCGGGALLIALAWRGEWKTARGWREVGVTLGTGALLVSPWHIRSLRLYGTWTPLPPAAPWFNPPLHGLELLLHPDFPALLALCNISLFNTLWSQRDWLLQSQTLPIGQYQAPQLFIYRVLAAFCALALAGHLLRLRKPDPADAADASSAQSRPASGQALTARRVSYGAFVLVWLTVLQVALSLHQGWAEGGRYLLPALGGFALWIARGFSKLVPTPRALQVLGALWCGGLLALNGVALYWIVTYLNPTYGPR